MLRRVSRRALSPDGLSEGSADGVTLSLDKVTKTRGHSPFCPCHRKLAHCLLRSRHRILHFMREILEKCDKKLRVCREAVLCPVIHGVSCDIFICNLYQVLFLVGVMAYLVESVKNRCGSSAFSTFRGRL